MDYTQIESLSRVGGSEEHGLPTSLQVISGLLYARRPPVLRALMFGLGVDGDVFLPCTPLGFVKSASHASCWGIIPPPP